MVGVEGEGVVGGRAGEVDVGHDRDTPPTGMDGGGRSPRGALGRGGRQGEGRRHSCSPCMDRASAFDPPLTAGLSRIRHGAAMSEPVAEKAEGWKEWLEKYHLWEEERTEEANYLRFR